MAIARSIVVAVDLNITVALGTGSATFYSFGELVAMAFKVPSGSPTYDYEILDVDGFGVIGGTGLVGATTVLVNQLCQKTNTLTITNATVNGVYPVRLWLKGGA